MSIIMNNGQDERIYPRCFYMEIVPVIAADQNVYTCHNNAYEFEGEIGYKGVLGLIVCSREPG